MNRDNKGRPGFKTLDGWGTDLDTRRLKVTDPSVSGVAEEVDTLNTTIKEIEEQNVLSDLEAQYKGLMENERYASDRRGFEIR
jgi:hypothetical protein